MSGRDDALTDLNRNIHDLNRDFGELAGLFKAHIKETDRDRATIKHETRSLSTKMDALGKSVDPLQAKIEANRVRLDAQDKLIADQNIKIAALENLRLKLAMAATIIGSAFALVWLAIVQGWPIIKSFFSGK